MAGDEEGVAGVGEDFSQITYPSKKKFTYPPPDGTGKIAWPASTTFASAISAGLPAGMKQKTLAFNATIWITLRVEED